MATVKKRPRGTTRISSKHQVTIPQPAFEAAGLVDGEVLVARADGPGRVVLERRRNPIEEIAGSLPGVWAPGDLDALRDEWD